MDYLAILMLIALILDSAAAIIIQRPRAPDIPRAHQGAPPTAQHDEQQRRANYRLN